MTQIIFVTLLEAITRQSTLRDLSLSVGSRGARARQVLRPGLCQIHVARDAGSAGHDARGDGPGGASASSARASWTTAVVSAATGRRPAMDAGLSADPAEPTGDRHRIPAAAGATTVRPATVSIVLSRQRANGRHFRPVDATATTAAVLATRRPSRRSCSQLVHLVEREPLSS